MSSRRPKLEPLELRLALDGLSGGEGPLVISELMAVNDTTLADEDGQFSDWIEIHNPTRQAVSLRGWYLTDDQANLSKWQFPDVSLGAGEYLVVFASDKDRPSDPDNWPGGELHTNFKLTSNGEYLALVRGDGTTVAHAYAPAYPPLDADVSYGLTPVSSTLLAEGNSVTYRVPTIDDAALGTGWTDPAYDDSGFRGGSPVSPVLISEAGTGEPDFVEIQNVSGGPADTSGWIVALNDAYDIGQPPDINALQPAIWTLPDSMAADEVLYRVDVDDGTGSYWGENVFWRTTGPGWAMIIEDNGRVADFAVWGYGPAELATLDVTVGGHHVTAEGLWNGDSIADRLAPGYSMLRQGNSDRDSAADFAPAQLPSMGIANAGLVTPFPSGPTTGVGFSLDAPGLLEAVSTNVAAEMHGVNASLWTRVRFDVNDPGGLSSLQLRMKYNDGFVAYLNGRQIADRNAPASPQWNSTATASRSVGQSLSYEVIDVSEFLDAVEVGQNVLAVQGLNFAAADRDFLVLPNLVGVDVFGMERQLTTPTPGEPNSMGVVINEIYYHPSNAPVPAEYIELYNTTGVNVDLSGWRFDAGVDYTFPVGASISAGGYAVVAQDPATFQASFRRTALGPWTGRLSDGGEQIELVDAVGARVDRVRYADEGDWGVREIGPDDRGHRGWIWTAAHDGGGKSLELVNLSLSNDFGQNWAASDPQGGTPGAPNSVAALDLAPMVLDVSHSPAIPRSTDSVAVTARLIDETTAGLSAVLQARRDGASTFSSFVMRDDGQSGDGPAGDGVYGATIPAYGDGTVIEFYVEATDAGGNTRTQPGPVQSTGQQSTNFVYQVDNAFNPNTPWNPQDPPVYRLILTEAQRAELWEIGNGSQTNAQMNATFVAVDGSDVEVRYNVGVRNRGNSSRGRPNNHRVNFVHDRPWHGVTRININARHTYLQVLGSVAFRMAGVVSPDAMQVKARVNGVDLANTDSVQYGSYAHVETKDGDFADAHFADDNQGNLYKVLGSGELDYRGTNPDSYRNHYFKHTNEDLDDWSDLIELSNVLNNAPDATFFADVSQVVNIDQWVRYLAVYHLIGNREGGFVNGRGDDYALYRGVSDPRFVLTTHDLDTLMGLGSSGAGVDINRSIFVYDGVTGLSRFLRHPEIVTRYYRAYLELIDTFYNPQTFFPLMDRLLGGWVPQAQINSMRQYLVDRTAAVLAQIPRQFTVTSNLPVVGGYPHTSSATTVIEGTIDAAAASSVLVGGLPALRDARSGQFSASVPLRPGLNRVLVRAFYGPDATGEVVWEGSIDIRYDPSGSDTIIPAGTISSDRTLTANQGPYRVTGNVTVAPGATLTITPGTTVFFDAGTRLTVAGRLVAEGTEHQQIRLTRTPGGGTFGGLQFTDTTEDNRIVYAVIEHGVSDDGMVGLEGSNLLLDHVTFDHTTRRRIRTVDSSLIVRNSTFTDLFAPAQPPTTIGFSEHVWGSAPVAGGHLIIQNNVFGRVKGENNAIQLAGNLRPDPVIQILHNRFLGGGHDLLELQGDALIEGNLFSDVHKDQFNAGSGEADAISIGGGHQAALVRNVFYNADHVARLKDGAFVHVEHNTVVGVSASGLYFDHAAEPGDPGRGARLDGNVFFDTPVVLAGLSPQTELTVDRSIVPAAYHVYGSGNVDEHARLADPAGGDFGLLPGSPASGSGPNGLDMGAMVPAGASISGEPPAVTARRDATLTVGGPGVTHYKLRVAGGLWTPEIPVDSPVQLNNLADGPYTLFAIGKDFAGRWQEEADATASQTWTIDSTLSGVRINEVLAINTATPVPGLYEGGPDSLPDLIELVNEGPQAVNLAGMSISDDPADPTRFVFPDDVPAETTIPPGGYLVLYGDQETDLPGLHLGFAIEGGGEGVFLYDAAAPGGRLIDSVEIGVQVADLSVGRVGTRGDWALTRPTFGAANVPQRTGDPAALKINEWFTSGEIRLRDDFLELYNSDPLPVALAGLFLTDDPVHRPGRHQIAPLSFAAGGGFATFLAEGDPQQSPRHLGFRLAADQELLALYGADPAGGGAGDLIDQIIYYPQTVDYSEGRAPDGADVYAYSRLPTPGAANPPNAGLDEALQLVDGLRITEIMYHPPELPGDVGGAQAEFIELSNIGGNTLNLEGVRLDGGIQLAFPPLWLPPGQRVVAVADLEAFEARYGPGLNVAGEYSGSLSDGGERIVLRLAAPLQAAVLRFDYDDAWYPSTDGGGFALEIRDPGTPVSPGWWGDGWDDPQNWQAGTVPGGTPASADGTPQKNVLINEVLTHTDPPLVDTIELYNPTAAAIDVGGWYLSDSRANFTKYRIPGGRSIPAGGYLVFDESDFNPTPQSPGPDDFALDGAHGDDVWLLQAAAYDKPVRVADHVEFGAAASGESLGRWPNGSGPLYPMTVPTLDKQRPQEGLNSGPRVGPVIISELHYNPHLTADDNDLEFIEIFNPTSETVELANWRLRRGIDFDFPEGTSLGPGGVLVVLPFQPGEMDKLVAFITAYGIDRPISVLGGYSGRLRDGGEKVQLQRPDEPPPDEPWFVPRLLEDEVIYSNREPWPTEPDGEGSSLVRQGVDRWGNDPASWAAGTPGPGLFGALPQVVGRHVFYNNSAFDGNNPAADAQDDQAIATDKTALLPGGTATFANYTSYSRGLSGIMVDLVGLPDQTDPGVGDFEFRLGNSNDPATWSALAVQPAVTVRRGDGYGGSDRVTLVWPDNAIGKQWLQVTVLANARTGLVQPDVFYFGNAIGESGNSTGDAKVSAADMLGARDNYRSFLDPAPIDFHFDYDRDARVKAVDMLIARNNQTHFLNALKLITVPPIPAPGEALRSQPQTDSLNKPAWLYEFEERGEKREERGGGSQSSTIWPGQP